MRKILRIIRRATRAGMFPILTPAQWHALTLASIRMEQWA